MEYQQQEIKQQKQHKRSKHRFFKVLLLCVSIMLVFIIAGAVFFWGYLRSFEASRLDNLIQAMQDNIDYSFWENSAIIAMAAHYTEFESGYAPLAPHLSMIRDVQYNFRQKIDGGTDENPVYIVRAGARDIGVVRFVALESVGHGFYIWEVESIEFLDSFIDGFCRSVSITASQNAQVYLNGVLVSQEYRVDCEFEHGATYLINNLFGEIEVSVFEFDGRVSSPVFSDNNEYFC